MGNRFRREDPQPAPQQMMAPPEMDDGFVQNTVPDEPFDASAVPEEEGTVQQQEEAAF